MARDFEDHCWRDIVSDEILKVYEPYRRDTYVGERPALLAIDLYNLVYRGGNYAEGQDQTKATYRWVMTATKKSPEKVGFRCVISEEDWKRR